MSSSTAFTLPVRPGGGPPMTPRQMETIKRMCRALGRPLPEQELSRSQASILISNLIEALDQNTGREPLAAPAPHLEESVVSASTIPAAEEQQDPVNDLFGTPQDASDPWSTDTIEGMEPIGDVNPEEGFDDEIDLDRPEQGLVPEGVGPFLFKRIISANIGPSGFRNIRFEAQALAGEGKGRVLTDNLSLSPKAAFRLYQFLDSAGFPRGGKVTPRAFVNRIFWGEVQHEEYDGHPQARFSGFVIGPADWTPESEASEQGAASEDEEPAELAELADAAAPAAAPAARPRRVTTKAKLGEEFE